MIVIIAGSRNVDDALVYVKNAVSLAPFSITEIVSGTAQGVDMAGEEYALSTNTKLTKFPADWERYGRSAGSIRNMQMAQYADALIAIWDGESPGTKNMISCAEKFGLETFVYRV